MTLMSRQKDYAVTNKGRSFITLLTIVTSMRAMRWWCVSHCKLSILTEVK